MSTTRHHAIIVTYWDKSLVSRARELACAQGLGPQCTEIVSSPTNAFYTFVITPDGSYEGWEESDTGNLQRAYYVDQVRRLSPHINVIAISYGGDGDSGPAHIEYDSKNQEAPAGGTDNPFNTDPCPRCNKCGGIKGTCI